MTRPEGSIYETIDVEQRRLARVRRAMPVIWGVVAFFGVIAARKVWLASRIAEAFSINFDTAIALVLMRSTERLSRSFEGYEVVFLDYVTAAFVETCVFAMGVVMLVLLAPIRRRQAAVCSHAKTHHPTTPDGSPRTERTR